MSHKPMHTTHLCSNIPHPQESRLKSLEMRISSGISTEAGPFVCRLEKERKAAMSKRGHTGVVPSWVTMYTEC